MLRGVQEPHELVALPLALPSQLHELHYPRHVPLVSQEQEPLKLVSTETHLGILQPLPPTEDSREMGFSMQMCAPTMEIDPVMQSFEIYGQVSLVPSARWPRCENVVVIHARAPRQPDHELCLWHSRQLCS